MLLPPAKGKRHQMPPVLRKIIAEWRNRIETTFKEITDQMELTRHGAHTFWGLLTRTAAVIAAHTLMRVCLAGQFGCAASCAKQPRCRLAACCGRRGWPLITGRYQTRTTGRPCWRP